MFFPLFYCISLPPAPQVIYVFLLAVTSGLLITVESGYIVVVAKAGGLAMQAKAATWGVCSLLGGIAVGAATAIPLSVT